MDNGELLLDVKKTIFHIDVNSAFLSWSAVKLLREEPGSVDLRTIPSAVAGDVNTRHGVITAKSIPAKKYGVVTGEPVVKALRKCPMLKLVKSDFNYYRQSSREFVNILERYTDLVQQVSIDEAFMDVTDLREICADFETPERPFPLCLADRIRKEIREELEFTVNVGISSNKLLAKMASDFEKPDKVHTLYPEEMKEKFFPLPIGELYGCGGQTARRLRDLGIFTIGDAALSSLELLQSILGEKSGEYIHRSANGIGSTQVHPEREEAKSVSNETTMAHDITASNYEEEMPGVLQALSESVARRLKKKDFFASTVVVMVKTNEFRRHSRQTTLRDPVQESAEIYPVAKQLMDELLTGEKGLFARGAGVRLVGVGTSGLDHGEYQQLKLEF